MAAQGSTCERQPTKGLEHDSCFGILNDFDVQCMVKSIRRSNSRDSHSFGFFALGQQNTINHRSKNDDDSDGDGDDDGAVLLPP